MTSFKEVCMTMETLINTYNASTLLRRFPLGGPSLFTFCA